MKKMVFLGVMLAVFMSAGAWVCSAQGPMEEFAAKQIDKVGTNCSAELEIYCKEVTPGGGREIACLYAHGDKLSNACERAFYDSAAKFQAAAAKINAIGGACLNDMEKFCSKVAVGEGRVMKCLQEHAAEITPACDLAVKDSKLES